MEVTTDKIKKHYDYLTKYYTRFWGEHIHHGYWENGEDKNKAQIKLLEIFARFAGIKSSMEILDVGCGIGGSARWLVNNYDVKVHGISISPVQIEIALRKSSKNKSIRYSLMDADDLCFDSNGFDVIWIIECIEHIKDKKSFIKKCFNILKPGGTFALCAWTNKSKNAGIHIMDELNKAMLCYSIDSESDYKSWMYETGFINCKTEDVSDNVKKTWDHCTEMVNSRAAQLLLKFQDESVVRFVNSFPLMQNGYAEKTLGYSMIKGVKPL